MIIKRIFAKVVGAGAVASSLAGVPPTVATPEPGRTRTRPRSRRTG